MTWWNQKRVYARVGVPRFEMIEAVEQFFRVEREKDCFKEYQRPSGTLP